MGHSTKLKYPPKVVLKELKGMLKELKDNKDIFYYGELFNDKEYTLDTLRVVVNRFRKRESKDEDYYGLYHTIIRDVVSLKKKISGILEARVVSGMLTGKINSISAMFLLKANRGVALKDRWVERQHTLKIQKDINVKYSIEQVPKLTNPRLIDGNIVNIDKPKE